MKKILHQCAGFTLVEIMIATSIAMVLLFGALYSTSETLSVVREGDSLIQTNVHARRSLDRMLKDFRYSSNLTVSGNPVDGWEIEVDTSGTLDPGHLSYTWNPNEKILEVRSEEHVETILTDLRVFHVVTDTANLNGENVVTRIKIEWIMGVDAGELAGKIALATERTFELAGATWIRRNDV